MALNLTIGPMALFALVASITPGPNNLLLMRSGARFGVRRSVPHLVGVQVGFLGLVLLSWLGVGAVLLAAPAAFTVLRWACFAYLLWLAAMILRETGVARGAAAQPANATQVARPMSWFEATAFQLINAKAWMMGITVVSAFYGNAQPTLLDIGLAALLCSAIGTPSMLVWNAWGAAIDRVLKRPAAHRAFNVAMALLVLATAVWMLF
jgi:threonine/homoserine/homoserine lactone efflux protein